VVLITNPDGVPTRMNNHRIEIGLMKYAPALVDGIVEGLRGVGQNHLTQVLSSVAGTSCVEVKLRGLKEGLGYWYTAIPVGRRRSTYRKPTWPSSPSHHSAVLVTTRLATRMGSARRALAKASRISGDTPESPLSSAFWHESGSINAGSGPSWSKASYGCTEKPRSASLAPFSGLARVLIHWNVYIGLATGVEPLSRGKFMPDAIHV
jgi:hypothetical protein